MRTCSEHTSDASSASRCSVLSIRLEWVWSTSSLPNSCSEDIMSSSTSVMLHIHTYWEKLTAGIRNNKFQHWQLLMLTSSHTKNTRHSFPYSIHSFTYVKKTIISWIYCKIEIVTEPLISRYRRVICACVLEITSITSLCFYRFVLKGLPLFDCIN